MTDWFGCELSVGDWVIYVPITNDVTMFRHGKVKKIRHMFSDTGMEYIYVHNKEAGKDQNYEDMTLRSRCIKLSQEEALMRKLESGL